MIKKVILILLMCLTQTPQLYSQVTSPQHTLIYELNSQDSTNPVQRFIALPIYKTWWNEVKLCSNLTSVSDIYFNRLKWFSVNSDGFMAMGHGPFIGYTYAWDDEIWIIKIGMYSERLVKHEMLHYLLWNSNIKTGDHPIEFNNCKLIDP
jgi:hypothetical protein